MATPTDSTVAAASTVSTLMGVVSSAKEKWDASGGNEMVSRVSASIPQGTKDWASTTTKSLFNRDHLRSMTIFFGLGEERPFYVEKSPSLLMARLRHNSSFFYLNYMLVFAILFVLTMITSFTTMIGLVLLGGCWLYVIRASADGTLKIGKLAISQKHATIVMGALSAVVLFYLLSHIFWWTTGSGGLLVAVHSFLRDASMHQDQDDRVEMLGDLSLEENAAFLNPVEGTAIVEPV